MRVIEPGNGAVNDGIQRIAEGLIYMIHEGKECETSQEEGEKGAMKAYAEDVRVKVLRAVDQGYPREEIVKLLGVSLPTIKRVGWTRKKRRWVPLSAGRKSEPVSASR
jgi:Homeodomain-like domain